MKQVIPFYKEIVFKTNIASITSISLEHEEKVFDGEVSGDFIVFGDYKIHNDTTEKELFKCRLPFTALIPFDVDKNTVKVEVEDFTYDKLEDDVIRVNIDFSISGDLIGDKLLDDDVSREIDDILGLCDTESKTEPLIEDESIEVLDDSILEDSVLDESSLDDSVVQQRELEMADERDELMIEEMKDTKVEQVIIEDNNTKEEVNVTEKEEYVTYHIHIVRDNETLEAIIKNYNVNLDIVKEYNDVKELKMGDKLIIPDYGDE